MTDRFIEEAEQMKRLKQKHPELRIPNVYDIFQIQDSWFIVMEYIKGSDLKIGSMNWQEVFSFLTTPSFHLSLYFVV